MLEDLFYQAAELEPINARPPSVMYHLRAFARPNRVLVGSAATALALVLGSMGTASLAIDALVTVPLAGRADGDAKPYGAVDARAPLRVAVKLDGEAEPTSRPTSAPTSRPTTTAAAASLADAHDLYISGRYDEAVEMYRALAAQPEKRMDAALGIARCCLMDSRYDEATAELASVEEIGARSPDWLTLACELNTALGRYDEAIEAARTALALDKGHFRAHRLLGELLEAVGKYEEAIEVYRWFDALLAERFPPDADAVTETAIGFHRFSILTKHPNINERTKYVLNELLQPAYTRMDRTCWAARVAAGDLLRSKYNLEEAAEDYQVALAINPNLAPAQVGLGRIALETWNFEEGEEHTDRALALAPRYVPALALRAEQKITERRYPEALEVCRNALETNPNDIRVLSLAAAAARALGDDETGEAMQSRVRKINARPALMHSILGDVLGGLRQYQDSEKHYLLAIEFDPADPNTRCELGMMYMQWGEEDKARSVLEAAWALDEFNARTQNTLELLDSLSKFATHETDHFIIRYDPSADAILARYMAGYLEDIFPELCADYATQPESKTTIEVFPSSRAFGVRITGKPWIHTVGACTGRIIALSAPRNDPKLTGGFNYAQVLRHEFTHTITLAATRNRIAHWFTEGLAVLQEDSPRSFEWSRMLADRVRRGELFTLESIDWGFMRPKRSDDRSAAYAQSEWMCEFLVERHGYDVINRMLSGFRDGMPQEQVFLKETGQGCKAFDAEFQTWARKQAEGWGFPLVPAENVEELRTQTLEKPENAALLGRLAQAELDAGNLEKALEAARTALGLDDKEKNGLEVLIKTLSAMLPRQLVEAARTGLEDEILGAADRLAEVDRENWTALKALGELRLVREELDQAEEPLKRLQKACPLDPFSYSGLSGIYLKRKQPDLALPQLLEVVRRVDDDAGVPVRIAEIYSQREELSEARYWYTQAFYIDPFTPGPHAALASVLMRMGDTTAAVEEYEVLCALEPNVAQHFFDTALAYRKLGEAAKTKEYARKAVELDPASPAKALLE